MELLRLKKNSISNIEVNQQNSILEEEILNEKIKFIKSGVNHTIIVTNENNIFVNGNNIESQCLINKTLTNSTSNSSNFKTNNISINGNKIYGNNLFIFNNFSKLNDKFYKYNEVTFNNITNLECFEDFTIIVNNYNEFYFTHSFHNIDSFIKNNFIGYASKKKELLKVVFKFINEEIILMRCTKRILYILTKSNKFYKIHVTINESENINYEDIKLKDCFKLINIKNNFYKIKDIQCGRFFTLLLDGYGNLFLNKELKREENKLISDVNNIFIPTRRNNDLSNVEFTKINFTKTLQILSEKKGKDNFFILTEKNEIFNYKVINHCYSNGFQFIKIIFPTTFTNNLFQNIFKIQDLFIIKTFNNQLFIFNYNNKTTNKNKEIIIKENELLTFNLNLKRIYPFLFDKEIYFLTTNNYDCNINTELEQDNFYFNNLYNAAILHNKLTDISLKF
ncbi:hypothetical protein ABK040_008066 [Willaertia magna]